MTRKDFELVARVIKEQDLCKEDRFDLVSDLADEFKEANSRFNPKKFFEACGVVGGYDA